VEKDLTLRASEEAKRCGHPHFSGSALHDSGTSTAFCGVLCTGSSWSRINHVRFMLDWSEYAGGGVSSSRIRGYGSADCGEELAGVRWSLGNESGGEDQPFLSKLIRAVHIQCFTLAMDHKKEQASPLRLR